MMYSRPLWKLAGCALALAGCASAIQEKDVGFFPAPPRQESTLVVRNDYFGEMHIYAVTGSTRTRIGAVQAGRSANFRLPPMLLIRPQIQFQIDPVGPVGPFTYRPIVMSPGALIELSVAPTLQMSSYAIVVH